MTGGVMRSPGVAAAEQARLLFMAESQEVSGDHDGSIAGGPVSGDQPQSLAELLPSRFSYLTRSSATATSSPAYKQEEASSNTSTSLLAPHGGPYESAASLSPPSLIISSSPSSVQRIASTTTLSSVLESLQRLLTSVANTEAATLTSATPPGTLAPPETAIPWLAADDLESGVRYISLQVCLAFGEYRCDLVRPCGSVPLSFHKAVFLFIAVHCQ